MWFLEKLTKTEIFWHPGVLSRDLNMTFLFPHIINLANDETSLLLENVNLPHLIYLDFFKGHFDNCDLGVGKVMQTVIITRNKIKTLCLIKMFHQFCIIRLINHGEQFFPILGFTIALDVGMPER